jgi:hypothetical protein
VSGAPALAWYVSAHGYGHGVRSCDILRALLRLRPNLRIVVTSDLPAPFFHNRLGRGAVELRPGSFDVGMVQLDSVRVDVPATLERVERLYEQRPAAVEAEIAFFRSAGIAGVVADIPAIPLEAAAEAGLRRIAVGNFAWDWIYSAFVERDRRWEPLVGFFQEGYRCSDLLLRLPFADEMKIFPRREDVPIVASPGTSRRRELADLTGGRDERKWVLLSFTSLDWDDAALDRVAALGGYEFFTVEPLAWRRGNIHPVDRRAIPFCDVLASVDAVVSKPGFGILSECVVNRKPLAYVDRTDFLEYALLEAAIRRFLKSVHIPAAKLYAGDIGEAVDALWTCPEPAESLPSGGAEIAARRIAAVAGL